MSHFYDDDFDEDELSEKDRQEIEAIYEKERRETENHPLYAQAGEVERTLNALLSGGDETSDFMFESQARLLNESMMIVKAKLYSALLSKNYLVSMQNAALIREHAQFIRLSSHTFKQIGFDESYITVFRQEAELFRNLFMSWAKEIKQLEHDEEEDEWGLF